MNIILIGFMGTGKSEVGHRLAKKLNLKFVDTDELIEKAQKMKISDIFAQKGEGFFRNLETETLGGLMGLDGCVISTGGGMILKEENVKMLKQLGPLVLLWSNKETIFERLKHVENRPLIQGEKKKRIKEILEARTPIYNKAADLKVDTSDLSLNHAVEEIIKWVNK